jgi:hypothetical protein
MKQEGYLRLRPALSLTPALPRAEVFPDDEELLTLVLLPAELLPELSGRVATLALPMDPEGEEERVETLELLPELLPEPLLMTSCRAVVVVRGAISVRVATLLVTSGAWTPEVRVRLSPETAGAVSLVPADRVVAGRE